MKHLKILFLAISVLVMPTKDLIAEVIGTDLKVTNGYRRDKITTSVTSFGRAEEITGKDHIKAQDISIYQIGAKGSFGIIGCTARGEINYGWIHNGKYSEISKGPYDDFQTTTAHIHKGKIRDVTVGGIYFLLNNSFCQLGPSGGYSKNLQRFTLGKTKTDCIFEAALQGLKYKNQWQGPWVGIDAVFRVSRLTIKGAYEYHFGRWNAKWKLQGVDNDIAYSDKRKSNHVRGKVAFIDASCNFCDSLTIGLGVKWQRWKAHKGQEIALNAIIAEILERNKEKNKVKYASWDAIAATIDLGYSF